MGLQDDRLEVSATVPRVFWRRALRAMRSDFYLGLVTLFGLCAVLIILPFAWWRFMTGQWVGGFGDLALVALLAGLVVYAWWSGRAQMACIVLGWTVTAGYLALIGLGASSELWTYPVIVACFLLADRYSAVLASIAALMFVGFVGDRLEGGFELASYLATGVMVAVFGLLFSTRNNAQQRQLAVAAERDALTGARNRRAMRAALDQFGDSRNRPEGDAALIVMDLDYFKDINDRFGHEKGDEILVSFVRLAGDNLRQNDRLFRMGGEEFVALLPGTDREGAVVATNKLLVAVRDGLEVEGQAVTVSAGVAELRDESADEWLARADRALYRAKDAGRDRVEVAD